MTNGWKRSRIRWVGAAFLVLTGAGAPLRAATAAPDGCRPEDRVFLHRLERGEGASPSRVRPAGEPASPLNADCPHSLDALHYSLALSIDPAAHMLSGHVDLIARALEPALATMTLDLDDTLTVDSVRVNGLAASWTRPPDRVAIALASPPSPGDSVTARISYHGPGANEGTGGFGGFWWNFQVAFSMGVGLYATPPSMGRAWFPCFDVPCDKATFDLAFTVPLGQVAASNGTLVSTVPDSAAGKVTFTYQHGFPMSTYLAAVSVSNYTVLPDSYYANISYHVYPGRVTSARQSFSHVHRMMDCYIANYGPYPFDRFGYMLASKGDMEHQTRVTHLANLVNGFHNYDNIVAHELSHQWWGDAVTVADWRDVWLSEGFATWSEALYMGWRDGFPAYQDYMGGLMDSYLFSGETGPVYDPSPVWGSTSYEKGACVLHMLRHVLGDSIFFDTLHTEWNAHAYGNHTTADFEATAEAVSGQDLDWFFGPWIHEPGYPVYQWSWWSVPIPGGGGYRVTVTADQVQSFSTVFAMPIDFRIQTASGDTTVTAFIGTDPGWAQFTVPASPTGVIFDPDNWLLDQHTQVSPSGTSVSALTAPAARLALVPNPATTVVRVDLSLARSSRGRIEIIDARGRCVKHLYTGDLPEGAIWWTWDRRNDGGHRCPAGAYVVRVIGDHLNTAQKLLLID